MKKEQYKYGVLIFSFIIIGYIIVLYKIIVIQVFSENSFDKKAGLLLKNVERYRLHDRKFRAIRGDIYSANGALLATSLYKYKLFIDGSLVPKNEIEALCDTIVKMFPNINAKKLKKDIEFRKKYILIAKGLDENVITKIKKNHFRGVFFPKDVAVRIYPMKNLAPKVVGIYKNGITSGIERSFDAVLKGTDAKNLTDLPSDGADIYLTIDENIQFFVKRALKWGYSEFEPKAISAVVMDPKTGEVLAMGNYPAKLNYAIADGIEPGSSFKIVTLLASLEEGIVDESSVINCENGVLDYNGVTIRDTRRNGDLTLSEVFEHSSNVGVIKIADLLGKEKLYKYAKYLGFCDKKSIDLPNEARSYVRPTEKWAESDLANIAIGYGISTNLLRLVNAYTSLANGGVLLQPHIVKKVVFDTGKEITVLPLKIRRVVSKETAKRAIQILTNVVKFGTGKLTYMENIDIAGKTGTAMIYDYDKKRYIRDRVIGTFIGFFPAENPKYVVGIMIKEPKDGRYAYYNAVPVFKKIALELIRYGGI